MGPSDLFFSKVGVLTVLLVVVLPTLVKVLGLIAVLSVVLPALTNLLGLVVVLKCWALVMAARAAEATSILGICIVEMV